MTPQERNEQLAIVSKDLMFKEPFYGLFLMMLNKEWNNRAVETAGVSRQGINYQLYLNEKFWDSLSSLHRRGLLKHELLHIGFFHLTDFDHLSNKLLANIAKDCEINQYIDKDWLPEGGVLPELFPELNLPLRAGTIFYYNALMKGAQNGSCPNLNSMIEAAGAGKNKVTVKVKNGASSSDQEIDIPNHDSWDEFDDLDEATQKLIKRQVSHILNEVAEQTKKGRGTVPGEFEEILKRINHIEPPKFDWKGFLRRFAGGSVKVFTKKTRRKDSKRFEGNPGLKVKPKNHILVAIDTSGSVSTNELKEFMQEIHHIHKTGADVTIAQADTAISHIGKYNPRADFTVKGRGGTNFQPVIDYYNANARKYSCLIYLTDGEASAPTKARGRMLWVMSSKSNLNPDLKGPQIKLN